MGFELHSFKPKVQIDAQSFLAINGKPGSGKSTLAIETLAHLSKMDDIDGVLVASESINTICDLVNNDHIHKLSYLHIVEHKEADSTYANQFLWNEAENFISDWLNKCRKRYENDRLTGRKPRRMVLVLDDCASDKKQLSSKMMMRIYSNFRQLGVVPIIITQELYQLPKVARNNVTHIFTFPIQNANGLRQMYDAYFSIVGNRKRFERLMRIACAPPKKFLDSIEHLSRAQQLEHRRRGPRGVLVYDTRYGAGADVFTDCCYYYYPKYKYINDVKWRIGRKIYFDMANALYQDPREVAAERERMRAIAEAERARREAELEEMRAQEGDSNDEDEDDEDTESRSRGPVRRTQIAQMPQNPEAIYLIDNEEDEDEDEEW